MSGNASILLVEEERRAVEEAQRGSLEALGVLYQMHAEHVYRCVLRYCDSADEAQDVVQEVFVGLPEALGRFEAGRPLGPWLRRVAIRVALNRSRGTRRRLARETNAAPPANSAPDGGESRLHAILELNRALQQMPANLRAVLLLREVEGYSHAEISSMIGIAEGTSASRLHRAWRWLRNQLGPHEG